MTNVAANYIKDLLPKRVVAEVDPLALQQYTGSYQFGPGVVATVVRKDNGLSLEYAAIGQQTYLLPMSDSGFFSPDDTRTEFVFVKEWERHDHARLHQERRPGTGARAAGCPDTACRQDCEFDMHITETIVLKTAGLTLACVLLSACDDGKLDTSPIRTETRDVGAFDSIDMDGDGKLQIQVGSPPSLTIEGPKAVLAATRSEVRGDTLYIKSRRNDWIFFGGRQRISVRIAVPSLASLKVDGGNEVRLSGFNGGESKIKVQGAAHLQADGNLDELTVYMAGAGHADLSRLVANDVKVTVDGVGSVYVNSKESLNATMNGVGAILYTGNPHAVSTSMNGVGTIAQREPEDKEKRERRKHERGDERPPADPDALQPEYEKNGDKKQRKGSDKVPPGGVTEVI